jgi:hypothetical protein
MAAWLSFECPVEGCTYTATLRLGMGEETESAAHRDRRERLRAEHPNHPSDNDESSATQD